VFGTGSPRVYPAIGSMRTITTQPTVTIYLAELHSAMLRWVKRQTLHNHMLAIEPELISRCPSIKVNSKISSHFCVNVFGMIKGLPPAKSDASNYRGSVPFPSELGEVRVRLIRKVNTELGCNSSHTQRQVNARYQLHPPSLLYRP